MVPKIAMDADGDIPPCSTLHDLKHAEEWDAWKQEKYGGQQKARSAVVRFHENQRRWAELDRKMREVAKTPIKALPKQPWWRRFFACFRSSQTQRPVLATVVPVADAKQLP
jgi:hypothetical protein